MAFSFTRLIMEETGLLDYKKGLEFVDIGGTMLGRVTNCSCRATLWMPEIYQVRLEFARIGSPAYSCSCVDWSCLDHRKKTCAHIIAASLAWDRSRNIPDPDNDTIEYFFGNKDKN
jgi:hypothetical protein